MTPDLILDLSDGVQGGWEAAYQGLVWALGLGLLALSGVFAYRQQFMDVWSVRKPYVWMHAAFGMACSVSALTCFWPGLRQTDVFTIIRVVIFLLTALYLVVTTREGIPYHVPGYHRKPRCVEPDTLSPAESGDGK